jgi:hypothetical protein
MTECKIDYIENLDWLENKEAKEFKSNLYNTISELAKQIKSKGIFSYSKDKLILSKDNERKHKEALILFESLNQDFNYISLVEDPDNNRFNAVRIDVITPHVNDIKKHISNKDFKVGDIPIEQVLELQVNLFGFTKLARESFTLTEELNKKKDELAPVLKEFIDGVSSNLGSVVQQLGKNSRFNFNGGRELIQSLGYFKNENKELAQKAVRYFFDSLSRLNYFKAMILKEDEGVQQSLKILDEIDINAKDVTPEQIKTYIKNSKKISTVLNDSKPYSRYFDDIAKLKTIMEENGIVSNPFSRYNGVLLEQDILNLLQEYDFNEIEALEILEEALDTKITDIRVFTERLKVSLLSKNSTKKLKEGDTALDIDQFDGNLNSVMENAIKKDKYGTPLPKTVSDQLIELNEDYTKIKNKLKVLEVDFISKLLYDEQKSGKYEGATLEKARDIVQKDLNEDSIISKFISSTHQMKDEFIGFSGKIINDHVIRANDLKVNISSDFETLKNTDEKTLKLIQDNIVSERLYLPRGEDLVYLDLEDTNPDSQIFEVGGKKVRVLLKKNYFLNQEFDLITSNINHSIFKDNLPEFIDKAFTELTSIDRNSIFVHARHGGIILENEDEVVKKLRNNFNLPFLSVSNRVKKALYEYFQNEKILNENELKDAIKGFVQNGYYSKHTQDKTQSEREQLLEELNIESLSEPITTETQKTDLKYLEKYYFKSYDFNSDNEFNLQYTSGVEEEYKDIDGVLNSKGYVLVLTSEDKIEKLYFEGLKGRRFYDDSSLDGDILKIYSLNWKFSKPASKYKNKQYQTLQSNKDTKPIQEKLLDYYKKSNSKTEANLQFGMLPQVLKSDIEKSLGSKIKTAKDVYVNLRDYVKDSLTLEVIDIDSVTQIIRSTKNYEYKIVDKNKDGTSVERTEQVKVGDLTNILGHLIFNEKGEKETNEENAARKALFGIDVNGDEIKRVNKKYTKLVDVDMLETDVLTNLEKFSSHAAEYSELKQAGVIGTLLVSVLKDRKAPQSYTSVSGIVRPVVDAFGKVWEKQIFDKVKILEGYVDTNVYGRSLNKTKVSFMGKEYDLHSAVNKLSSVVAFQALAFNIVAPIGNMTIGTMNNVLMSLQGKVLDPETYAKANKFYWKSMKNGAYADIFADKVNSKSLLGQVLQKFQAIQGLDYDITRKQDNKFGFRFWAYLSSSLPEYNLQGTLAIGILMKEQFNGESVFDIVERLYEQSKEDDTSFQQKITEHFGDRFMTSLTHKIQSANTKAHGNYIKGNQSQLQRIAIFSFALMFKKWIWSGLLTRYAEKQYSFQDKDYTEGYHRIFLENMYKGLLDDFKNPEISGWDKVSKFSKTLLKGKLKTAAHIGNVASSAVTLGNFKLSDIDAYREILYDPNVSESEQREMFRAASELTIFLSALILSGLTYGLGKGDDEEDDNQALLTASYYLTKLQFDTAFFLPYTTVPTAGGVGILNSWDSAWRIIQDPLTIERTLDNNIGLLGQIIGFYEDEEGYTKLKIFEKYKTSGNSYKKGDYKIYKKLKKSVFAPVHQLERFLNIEDQIRYLDMVQSTSK